MAKLYRKCALSAVLHPAHFATKNKGRKRSIAARSKRQRVRPVSHLLHMVQMQVRYGGDLMRGKLMLSKACLAVLRDFPDGGASSTHAARGST